MLAGPGQVAAVWGVAVALAIYQAAGASGAHLNPAVTLALAWHRPKHFARAWALPYAAAQLAGAVAAGLVVLAAFGPLLAAYETRADLVRGAPGSERAAMVFGQYFPNPAIVGTGPSAEALVSPALAVAVEALGTAVLVLVIFALTDPANPLAPPRALAPLAIGATVAALIAVFAPVTQAGWNPARDLGPRLVALVAGYGAIAVPGPRAGFWVYLVGPLLGGAVGGWLYERGLRPRLTHGAEPAAAHDRSATALADPRAPIEGARKMLSDRDHEIRLQREIQRIAQEFRGIFGEATIDRYVRESVETFAGSRVKDYVPLFVHRFTRERLHALAQVQGLLPKERPAVLYVCVHNAGRSQMAAALTERLSGGAIAVWSAGSAPGDEIHPTVVTAMAELGLDLTGEFPKPLTDEIVRVADVVITMGCGDACPIYPGKRYEDWPVADPAGQPLEAVRAIRDDIRARVQRLMAELQVPAAR